VFLAPVTSIIAIVLGDKAQKQIAQSGEAGAETAHKGRVLGIVSLMMSVALIVTVAIPMLTRPGFKDAVFGVVTFVGLLAMLFGFI
jgi:hypothetical protein